MTLSEVFSRNKNIIINTDIDGFLSGIILQRVFGVSIAGFSNSKKEIWTIPELRSIYDPVYVDLYVARPDVVCIDQHIIAHNKRHLMQIRAYGTKINPNVERGRTFAGDFNGDYYHKYPFGTVHFIASLLARERINAPLPDLQQAHTFGNLSASLGHAIMRADDALFSSLGRYAANAEDWWQYLAQKGNSPALQSMIDFADSCDPSKAAEYKRSIGAFFMGLGCDGQDGAFDNIANPDGSIQDRVQNFYSVAKSLMDAQSLPPLPSRLKLHQGKFGRVHVSKYGENPMLSQGNLYSYAYIYGPAKDPNFSFTTDMQD